MMTAKKNAHYTRPMDPRNAWLGMELRAMRIAADLTAGELGARLGCSEQTVFAYEQGRTLLGWDRVIRACHVLGRSARRLIERYERQWCFGPLKQRRKYRVAKVRKTSARKTPTA